jgi:hypothetical protein
MPQNWQLTRLDFPWFQGKCTVERTAGERVGRCGHVELGAGLSGISELMTKHYDKRHA